MGKKNISKKHAEKVLGERDPYVGIVLEEINDNLKILLDGHEIIQGRIDRLDGGVGNVEIGLDRLDSDMQGLRFDLRGKADKHEVAVLGQRVTKLETE
jgi:hypothetical protein